MARLPRPLERPGDPWRGPDRADGPDRGDAPTHPGGLDRPRESRAGRGRDAREVGRGARPDSAEGSGLAGRCLPPYETLGDLLLELDRPTEALEACEAALRAWPRRFNGLLGAARAARRAGELALAGTYYSELVEVASAETTRPGVREARAFLADGGRSTRRGAAAAGLDPAPGAGHAASGFTGAASGRSPG